MPDAPDRRGTALRSPFLWIGVVFVVLRFALFAGFRPAAFSDTESYINVFAHGFSLHWFGNERPVTYPLLLWLSRYNMKLIQTMQLLASSLCWATCAIAFAHFFSSRVARIIVFALVLLFSFSLDVLQWDIYVLTESFSISAYLLLLTLIIYWRKPPASSRWLLPLFAILALGFSFLRDVNASVLPMFALLILIITPRNQPEVNRPASRLPLLVALILFIIPLLQNIDVTLARRHWYNLENFLNLRVMIDSAGDTKAEHYTWLHDHHALPPESLARAGRNFENLPPMSPAYRQWLDLDGLRAWKSFLIHHPMWMLCTYFSSPCIYGDTGIPYFMTYNPHWRGTAWEIPVRLHAATHAALDPILRSSLLPVVLILALIASLTATWRSRLGTSPLPSIFTLLTYTAAVMLFMAKFGDAIEDWRHALLGLVAIYLSLCLLAGVLVNWLAGRLTRRSPTPPPAPEIPAP